ncbi:hypothetical protein SESBI_18469 [Sesbania bispinosa]|nr:hypothetical protein SESBI_18469 [Sesbania bispinosa]
MPRLYHHICLRSLAVAPSQVTVACIALKPGHRCPRSRAHAVPATPPYAATALAPYHLRTTTITSPPWP